MKRLHKHKIDDAEYYDTKIWAEEANQRPYYDAVRQRALLKKVQNGDKVADVGAGVFGACQYLAEETDTNAELWCFDQSEVAKELVTKKNPQINFVVGLVEKILAPDNYFDCVIAGEIIEHMEDPADFCKELVRICKPNGWISLSTVDTNSENAIKHGDYPEHLWEFTKEDLVSFFEPYGSVQYKVVGDYHFIYCRLR